MNRTFKVELELTDDGPNSINFEDTYEGLNDEEWYKFSVNEYDGILLQANQEGFEHLARYFLKLSRTGKSDTFHSHHALEFGQENYGEPELTIVVTKNVSES
ncbi:hypothetical protein Lepto7375DRAFT_0226 [Leptolyngbya sp. PCC 7375]|nr:hypothetical protein Lepto7375DRAFT_0226 [Leptolyngbya sp. PCC 7375]